MTTKNKKLQQRVEVIRRAVSYNETPLSVEECSVRGVLDHVGGKWSTLIIVQLSQRACRFGELKRAISDISQRMLTQTLRELQRDGFLTREVHPTSPPSVEYRLTPMGHSFMEPLCDLLAWANDHQAAIQLARTEFDKEIC